MKLIKSQINQIGIKRSEGGRKGGNMQQMTRTSTKQANYFLFIYFCLCANQAIISLPSICVVLVAFWL